MRCNFLGLILTTLMMATVACHPVDKDGTFTVSGRIESGAGGETVYLLKVDHWVDLLTIEPLLQADVATLAQEGNEIRSIHTATTDGYGGFTFTLQGSEVNTDGGFDVAYLSVLHQSNVDPFASPATMTDWHQFTDTDPNWDVGVIVHWDNIVAGQNGDDVEFEWLTQPA